MANFKFPKQVVVELDIDSRYLDYDDNTMTGESVAYILGGREEWEELVLQLYEKETDAGHALEIVDRIKKAFEDTQYFQKIFAK